MSAAEYIQAFDRNSPDAAILDAFEKVLANKVWTYEQEDSNGGNWPDAAAEAQRVDEQFANEEIVSGSTAYTLPGVAARLQLLVPALDNSRWVDRGLAEHGPRALLQDSAGMDGYAIDVLRAVRDLLRIGWEQALARYELSCTDFTRALALKGIVDRERFRSQRGGVTQSAFLAEVESFSDQNEDRFSNGSEVHRLLATLAPDRAAYLRKLDIAITEGVQDDAAPWLGRDTLFLLGRVERDAAASMEA